VILKGTLVIVVWAYPVIVVKEIVKANKLGRIAFIISGGFLDQSLWRSSWLVVVITHGHTTRKRSCAASRHVCRIFVPAIQVQTVVRVP
jgi:hypothetical protein